VGEVPGIDAACGAGAFGNHHAVPKNHKVMNVASALALKLREHIVNAARGDAVRLWNRPWKLGLLLTVYSYFLRIKGYDGVLFPTAKNDGAYKIYRPLFPFFHFITSRKKSKFAKKYPLRIA
jgi:hypothetical protein